MTGMHAEAITMAGHEIDLLLRVGKIVFAGDTKFQKYPANPNEIGNYYRELEHGAQQVLDRVKSLSAKRKEIKRLLKWPGDENELVFSPLIVSGHAYGAGMKFLGVPCLTLDMLEMLFREEKFVMSGFDGSIKGVRQIALRFEQSPDWFEGFSAWPMRPNYYNSNDCPKQSDGSERWQVQTSDGSAKVADDVSQNSSSADVRVMKYDPGEFPPVRKSIE